MGPLARLENQIQKIAGAWRVRVARSQGAEIAAGVSIASGVRINYSQPFQQPRRVRISAGAYLDYGCILDPFGGEIVLGEFVRVGPYSLLYGHGGLIIGSGVLIASHCQILSSNHLVSSVDKVIREHADIVAPTVIGPECWLGAGVSVLAGVTIGEGAVIGAGSVVTHDIPPFAIAMGVPATVRTYRTGTEQLETLPE